MRIAHAAPWGWMRTSHTASGWTFTHTQIVGVDLRVDPDTSSDL